MDEGTRRQVMDALREHFRPEFLNRIDEIIFFHALGREHMKRIIDIQIAGLTRRLEERKIHVTLTDAAKDQLVREGYDPAYGARPLKRSIQRRVLDPLAHAGARGRFPRRRYRGRRRRARRVDVHEAGARASSRWHLPDPTPPNPRGGDRRGASRLTSRPSSPLWYGLALLLVLGIAQAYFMTPPGRSIPYSEFKQLVKNGEVAEISIGDQSIRGTLKAGDAEDRRRSPSRASTIRS